MMLCSDFMVKTETVAYRVLRRFFIAHWQLLGQAHVSSWAMQEVSGHHLSRIEQYPAMHAEITSAPAGWHRHGRNEFGVGGTITDRLEWCRYDLLQDGSRDASGQEGRHDR